MLIQYGTYNKYSYNNPNYYKINVHFLKEIGGIMQETEVFVNILYKSNKFTLLQYFDNNSFIYKLDKKIEQENWVGSTQSILQGGIDIITPGIIKYTVGKGAATIFKKAKKFFSQQLGKSKSITTKTIETFSLNNLTPENALNFYNNIQNQMLEGENLLLIQTDKIYSNEQIINMIEKTNIESFSKLITLRYDNDAFLNKNNDSINDHILIFNRNKIIGTYSNNIEDIINEYVYTNFTYSSYGLELLQKEQEVPIGQLVADAYGGKKKSRKQKKQKKVKKSKKNRK